MDKFLKRGILDSMLEVWDDGGEDDAVDADEEADAEASAPSDEADPIDVSDPVRDSAGWAVVFMSPKNSVARRTASTCGTPAKATTVRSGR